jgi:flagellar biosynthesis/type III secretory pathway chaperone
MNLELNHLAGILDEEIAVGDELRRNLAAQRQALVAWDMETLVATIEAREVWIRSLSELEVRRVRIVRRQNPSNYSVTLSHLITACPEGLPVRQRLQSVRARARDIFLRLQADERDLNQLMENLQSHLYEAFKPLGGPSLRLYGDTGTAAPQRVLSALIRNKA